MFSRHTADVAKLFKEVEILLYNFDFTDVVYYFFILFYSRFFSIATKYIRACKQKKWEDVRLATLVKRCVLGRCAKS